MEKNKFTTQEKYDRENTVRISLKLNVNTDKDILEKIDKKNKQASIKKLVREGIRYLQN